MLKMITAKYLINDPGYAENAPAVYSVVSLSVGDVGNGGRYERKMDVENRVGNKVIGRYICRDRETGATILVQSNDLNNLGNPVFLVIEADAESPLEETLEGINPRETQDGRKLGLTPRFTITEISRKFWEAA